MHLHRIFNAILTTIALILTAKLNAPELPMRLDLVSQTISIQPAFLTRK